MCPLQCDACCLKDHSDFTDLNNNFVVKISYLFEMSYNSITLLADNVFLHWDEVGSDNV